ncbi:hypothetical protein E2C01_041006 [Portunus trituberculatus]|uniref:Uncharacterized protein n=1 Tax=Portunus trituberculatus TaxID=210409 RepID=A0A5B7FP50_PORTR|nr:hypothetical protein [Portunus trituberculatus]
MSGRARVCLPRPSLVRSNTLVPSPFPSTPANTSKARRSSRQGSPPSNEAQPGSVMRLTQVHYRKTGSESVLSGGGRHAAAVLCGGKTRHHTGRASHQKDDALSGVRECVAVI